MSARPGRQWIDRRCGRWYALLDTTNRSRLSAFCYFEGTQDDRGRWNAQCGIQCGNGNSDPVFTLSRDVRLSERATSWIERHAERLERWRVSVG